MNLPIVNLSRGQRVKIADLVPDSQECRLGISVNAPGRVVDFACFGPDAAGKFPRTQSNGSGLPRGLHWVAGSED